MMTIGFLAVAIVAAAATVEYKYENGKCDGSSAGWWSVTTVTDGVPTHITGRDCSGKLYDKNLPRRVVAADPIDGLSATFTGSCGITTWRIVIVRDAAENPVWMGGQTCDAAYWVIDNFDDPAPGDDDGLH